MVSFRILRWYSNQVPKIVFDEPTIKALVEKLAGFPIELGPDGNLVAPGVQDLVDGNEGESPWQPADERTKLLVLGGEACREISFGLERFGEERARKRILKGLSVPVCSLMDVAIALLKSLNDEVSRKLRLAWPASDRNNYLDVGRRLRKVHTKGPVRTVRHKLGAHLDTDVFGLGDLNGDPKPLLAALGDALIALLLSFNHRAHAFSWIRPVFSSEDGTKLVVDTMFDYPLSVRWVTDADGKVLGVGGMFLAEDPRRAIHDSVIAAGLGYNLLVQATGVNLPTMYMRPTADVLSEEGRSSERSYITEALPSEMLVAKKAED